MSLDDATKKMSKSNPNPNSRINLLDSPDLIRSKIMKATTDSDRVIKFDALKLGIINLVEIYQTLTGMSKEQVAIRAEGKGYGDFKKELAEVVIESMKPLQKKYQELMEDPATVERMLIEGAEKLVPIAEKTLGDVRAKVGLGVM